jgi:hypothetical protein
MSLYAYHRPRVLLLAAIVVSVLVFYFASQTFRVPAYPHYGGVLIGESNPTVATVVVAVAILAAVLLSTLIAGTVRFDAGLFCGVLGMATLSTRSGSVGDILRQVGPTNSPVVFLHFTLELVLLYAFVSLAWSVLWSLHSGGLLKGDEFRDGVEDTDEPLIFKISAFAMQAAVTAAGIFLLAQSDAKAQVLAAVGVSSFAGACAAYYMYPISPSPWLWTGPLAIGCVGYVMAYFDISPADPLWQTGHLTHTLAPLARPLPIDYATFGPAGAILAYWLSRRWHRERMIEQAPAHDSQKPIDPFVQQQQQQRPS